MMHKALQKSVPVEKLDAMASTAVSKAGKLESITYAKERFDTSEGQALKVFYTVDCEKGSTTAEVDFQLIGLKGHILAFSVPGKE